MCSCSENGTLDADLSDHIVVFIHHYQLLLSYYYYYYYYYSTSIVVVVVINVSVTLFSGNCIDCIDLFNQSCFLYSLGSTTTQATNCSGFSVLPAPTF